MKEIISKYKKRIIIGGSAIVLTGVVLTAAMVTGGLKEAKKSKEPVKDVPIIEVSGDVEFGNGNADIILDYLLKDDSDMTATGVVEYQKGIGEKFEEFCQKAVVEAEADGELIAKVEKIETTMKLEPEKVESVVSGYTNLGIVNTGSSYLNVRAGAGTKYKKVGTMPSYAACEILEEAEDGWYKIKSGKVTGYVSAQYILTGAEANKVAKEKMETVVVVDCNVLNVRVEPNTDCNVFTSVKKGEELELEEELDGWLKININNLEGYVSRDYVKYVTKLPTAVEIVEVTVNNNSNKNNNKYSSKDFASGEQAVPQKVKDLIDYALQFLGNPYVRGGNSLTKGTDCSGFTKLIFAKFGYTLARTVEGQATQGKKIALKDVRPGDLLLYKYNGKYGHVAIYIGNGKIVHASTPKGGIRIGNALYTTPARAIRIIE